MLINERKLRSIVREIISEQNTGIQGLTSGISKDRSGYEFEIRSDGRIRVVKQPPRDKNPLGRVLPPEVAQKVAQNLIKMGAAGAKGTTLQNIAAGSLKYVEPKPGIAGSFSSGASGSGSGGTAGAEQTAAAAATAQALAKAKFPAGKGLVLIGRQDFFPLDDMVGAQNSKVIADLIGQGHAFAVVVDPNNGNGYRFEFGRYEKALKCKDERWLTQAGEGIFRKLGVAFKKGQTPEQAFNELGVHTMGVTEYQMGTVKAVVSKDGKTITNLKEFCKGLRKPKDKPGNVVVIPVSNIGAALQYARSQYGVCHPYALPGFGALTTADTMNCGIFAQRVLQAGAPDQTISIEAKTLFDTPDALYNTAAGMGYQTGTF